MKREFLFMTALTLAAPLASARDYVGGSMPEEDYQQYLGQCMDLMSKKYKAEDAHYFCSNPYLEQREDESAHDRAIRLRLTKDVEKAKIEMMSKVIRKESPLQLKKRRSSTQKEEVWSLSPLDLGDNFKDRRPAAEIDRQAEEVSKLSPLELKSDRSSSDLDKQAEEVSKLSPLDLADNFQERKKGKELEVNIYTLSLKSIKAFTQLVRDRLALATMDSLQMKNADVKATCEQASKEANRLAEDAETFDKLPMQSDGLHKVEFLNEFQKAKDEALKVVKETRDECREMQLRRSGGLDIGTTSPNTSLDVSGAIGTDAK